MWPVEVQPAKRVIETLSSNEADPRQLAPVWRLHVLDYAIEDHELFSR